VECQPATLSAMMFGTSSTKNLQYTDTSKEEDVNIPLLDSSPTTSNVVEDNLQFMENSYPLNSPTTSIDISKEPASASDNQAPPKMSLPVNLSFASPVIREWASKRRQEIRPWGTFVKTTNFEPPASLPKWSKRLYKNIEHFQSNYVFVFLILFLYCLITSPFLIVAMAASGGGCYYASLKQGQRKLILGGREVTLAQQYAAIAVASIPLFVFAGAGTAVFWVIGASFFIIALHASFYNFDALDLPLDDTQQLTGQIIEEV